MITVHTEDESFEDESNHLWAVSYADFLMVLLSFTMLFFSLQKEERKPILKLLAEALGAPAERPHPVEPVASRFKDVVDQLKKEEDLNVELIKERDQVLIHLPDQLYRLGQVHLSTNKQLPLRKAIKTILPYIQDVQVTLIGHADAVPLHARKHNLLQNNFDLSSLRATYALQLAVEMGLPPDSLLAQGTGEYDRKSRSLSILIQARDKK